MNRKRIEDIINENYEGSIVQLYRSNQDIVDYGHVAALHIYRPLKLGTKRVKALTLLLKRLTGIDYEILKYGYVTYEGDPAVQDIEKIGLHTVQEMIEYFGLEDKVEHTPDDFYKFRLKKD